MNKIVHIIAGLNDGGAEAVLYRLCKNDTKCEHVVVSMMSEGKYGPLLKLVGVEVACLHMPRGKLTLSGVLKLWGTLRDKKPDAVQTWMFHADLIGGVIARLAGITNISWGVHSSILEPTKVSFSTRMVAKICAGLSSWVPQNIIYCAERSRIIYEKLGYAADKGRVIPNGYDISEFQVDRQLASDVLNELGLDGRVPILGMVARFDPQKDHQNLIKALALLKKKGVSFCCLLIGSDVTKENELLVGWITDNELTDEVMLLGKRNDIPAIMNALDLHVLSSSYGEAFPNVICEAMACGTPCVTTDVGDSEFIVAETGWVVPSDNTEQLATSIAAALHEMESETLVWEQRKIACLKRITENFSIGQMVGSYLFEWNREPSNRR